MTEASRIFGLPSLVPGASIATMQPRVAFASILCLSSFLSSCSSVYYGAAETFFGKQKRDILVSRVESARKAQESTKTEFASAREVYGLGNARTAQYDLPGLPRNGWGAAVRNIECRGRRA